MPLENQVAIITGASSGIGEAIARLFAAEGARLALAARSEERLNAVARALEVTPARALVVPTDVRQPDQVRRLVARTMDAFGTVDILVNNAGIGVYAPFERVNWEHFSEMWEVNFFGAAYAMHEVIPIMKQRGRGTIVNISSVAGRIPLPFMAAYCGTKFALNAFSDALRMELARDRIRVVLVCPGRVRTPFHERAYYEGGTKRYKGRLGGGISAERVARATLRATLAGRREVVVPASHWLAIGFRALFPTLTDRLIRGVLWEV